MSDPMADALRLGRELAAAEARGFERGWQAAHARMRAEGPAEEAEAPERDGAAVVGPPRRAGDWISEARKALLRELVPQGVAWSDISARLAEVDASLPLPGPQVLINYAKVSMGLRRPATAAQLQSVKEMHAARMARRAERQGLVSAAEALICENDAAAHEQGAPGRPAPAWAKPTSRAEHPLDTLSAETVAPSPPRLPLPDAGTGKIYASFAEVRAWAGFYGIAYDGGNMDRVNKLRAAKGLAPLVQVESPAGAAA